jgi:dihydrofolate synthase/folylpolyglutamate synthase
MAQMASIRMGQHWLIWGMVNDKDHRKVISLLPRNARYIACQPDIPRALPATEMNVLLLENGLESTMISKVEEALSYCLEHAAKEDVIYVGGSTFTVASLPEKFFSEGN